MRVVIVDDEPIIRMDIREILEAEGYTVAGEAGDGYDAIEVCRTQKPDCVIMDVEMPLMDGLTASQIIYSEQLADAIVLLTAYDDRELIERAKEIGVSGYLVKPLNERSFVPALEIALTQSREIRRLKKEWNQMSKRLESRVIVEQAKGVLMSQKGLSEQDAYDYIRNVSKMKNIPMRMVAEVILMRRGK